MHRKIKRRGGSVQPLQPIELTCWVFKFFAYLTLRKTFIYDYLISLIMQPQEMQQMNSEKNWIVTLVLAIFVGTLGIDRFYSGSILLGILKLVTFGGLGLWWLIDLIMLVTGSYKDGNGLPIAIK